MKGRKVNVRAARQHSRRLSDRVGAGDGVAVMSRGTKTETLARPNGVPGGLPELDALRAIVKVAWRSLSREVIEDRRKGRY
jgi:hypothetical protein